MDDGKHCGSEAKCLIYTPAPTVSHALTQTKLQSWRHTRRVSLVEEALRAKRVEMTQSWNSMLAQRYFFSDRPAAEAPCTALPP